MKPNDLPESMTRTLMGIVSGFWGHTGEPASSPPHAREAVPAPTALLARHFHNAKGARDYLLYVPHGPQGQARPLIVMLHGCQQDPGDFAVGTQMNMLAERHGFLVAYPRQTSRANGANCWNWYEPGEQARDGQEPSLIAGIVDAIGQDYAVDPARVFVAGLSAGAAMAVSLGQAYPEVFAGVAAHSGLPHGAAHDVQSAFAAMQGKAPVDGRSATARASQPVRTLVLHGDADRTVDPVNGAAITRQAVAAFKRAKVPVVLSATNESDGARDFVDTEGRVMVRERIVPGGAHAWFGGHAEGSFTQPDGPDASAEIVQFFLQTPAPGMELHRPAAR